MNIDNLVKIAPNVQIGNKNQVHKIDWDLLEADYIHGYYDKKNKVIVYPTHQNLADIYKLHVSQVAQKSAKRNWGIKRETYKEMMSDQRMVELGKERCLRMSISMGDSIRRMEAINSIVDDKLGAYENDPYESDINARDLSLLQKIVADNHKLAKDVFGVQKSYEDMHKTAAEQIREKVKKGDEVSAADVAELINALKEKTINADFVEITDEENSNDSE